MSWPTKKKKSLPKRRQPKARAAKAKVKRVVGKKEDRKSDLVSKLIQEYGSDVIWTKERLEEPIEVYLMRTESLNIITARGGLPKGKIIEVSGPESSGKTTICYDVISAVQRRGGRVALIDAEDSSDPPYMIKCGIDLDSDKWLLVQPDYGEQACSIVERLVEEEAYDLIVVDSVAALIPRAEMEGTMTDQQIGLLARMMAKHMRRLIPALKGTKVTVMFTNQIRDKIGSFGYGPKTGTPGGRALKHACTVRIITRRTVPIKKGTKEIGFISEARCVKNKVGRPGIKVSIPILHGKGVSSQFDLVNLAERARVVRRKASMYYLMVRNKKTRKKVAKFIGNGWEEAYKALTKGVRMRRYVLSNIRKYFKEEPDNETED